jgi:hypothetical protein
MQTTAMLSALFWLAQQDAPAPAPQPDPSAAPATQAEAAPRLPLEALEGFEQTPAESSDDLFGQALLLEFFAHW